MSSPSKKLKTENGESSSATSEIDDETFNSGARSVDLKMRQKRNGLWCVGLANPASSAASTISTTWG